ncbi:GNAT family N-acetyltransferase [Streptococcus suis]|uniref:Histone acetyltransferase HPA2-like acetyltransferase n=1 Tax=Streptococcus suis TaxID=1307 RepID=A0A116K370_STRSU|nr:GNAT family N-acetyltransferase [Streptococcus suis]NQH91966.1 GNAT family N-acetyltransferase [Streptococcus suis]NQI12330.1 GNAT family N-acetyltransferase [Streptococcus suis]NQO71800.1 GNAT family N-acetyltransferase [Streptococcus suis]CYU15227.1 histone acetyltransferase HPA2-like acetyltransferase [Streptococcus suis]CYU75069.1 histone acetyltransferase HPA2-like acetyltransferase [Streptococcus suis]
MMIKPLETKSEMLGKAYVHWKSWQEAYADLLPQEFLKKTYTLERCQDWAVRYPQNILIAVMNDKVVGFACYGSSSQEDLPGAGELYALYVLTDYYDQKIGYQLMQAALKKLQSYEYEKVGFRFDGVKKTVNLGAERTEYRMILKQKERENG